MFAPRRLREHSCKYRAVWWHTLCGPAENRVLKLLPDLFSMYRVIDSVLERTLKMAAIGVTVAI